MTIWGMNISSTDVGMITIIAGKAFIILADSMPPPAENCGYWMRWFYDAVQKAASNGLKVGASRTTTQPPTTTLAPPTVAPVAAIVPKETT